MRKARSNAKAKSQYGATPHSFLLTPSEGAYLRRQYFKKYGHDWTLKARDEYAASQIEKGDSGLLQDLPLFGALASTAVSSSPSPQPSSGHT